MWFFVSMILGLILVMSYMFMPWYFTHYLPHEQNKQASNYPAPDPGVSTTSPRARRSEHREERPTRRKSYDSDDGTEVHWSSERSEPRVRRPRRAGRPRH